MPVLWAFLRVCATKNGKNMRLFGFLRVDRRCRLVVLCMTVGRKTIVDESPEKTPAVNAV